MAKAPTDGPIQHQKEIGIGSPQGVSLEKGIEKSAFTETSIVPPPPSEHISVARPQEATELTAHQPVVRPGVRGGTGTTQQSINFGNPDELKTWLGTQPSDLGIALAARSALRVFPMIGQPAGGLTSADAIILQARFRALSVAWTAFGPYGGGKRLHIAARATRAAASSLPIGTFATNPAASAAQRSAAQAVRALAGAGRNRNDAIFAAINEAFLAEVGFLDDARCVWALDQDIEFLSGGNPSLLADVPLWLNQPPTWAQQKWQALKATLYNSKQDWQVWTIWYDDRLDGRVGPIERELAYVDVPDELWRQHPAAVNASIVRRIGLLHPTIDPDADRQIIASGLPASPGAACGEIVFSSSEAELMKAQGRKVILVRIETGPEDNNGMHAAEGILTTRLGMSSHAAVLARSMGKPCVCGAGAIRVDYAAETMTAGGTTLRKGDIITIDGSTGQVLAGKVNILGPELSGEFSHSIIAGPHLPASTWADVVALFSEGSQADQNQGRRLSAAMASSDEERIKHYLSVFVIEGNTPRKTLISRGLANRYPALAKRLHAERNRLVQFVEGPSLPDKIEPSAALNWDFFLSYSDGDLEFARWINDVLSAAGFRVFAQFKDMPAGINFVQEMERGLARSSRVIALLSPAYQESDHCQSEWFAAYKVDPGGQSRKLVPFLISPTQLSPLAEHIVYKPLVGLSPLDAAKVVLETVGYRGSPPVAPPGWPGAASIDQMRTAAGGVYDVAPGPDLRLERMPGAVNETESGGHTPEQLFADAVSVVVHFSSYVQHDTGNYRCSERLRASAQNLLRVVTAADVHQCDYLAFNRELVWILRIIDLDKADGLIPQNDEIVYHASDLYGVYNRMERIFSKLGPYRKMEARDRFQLPDAEAENAIRSVCRSFGNPEIAGNALSPRLSEELKQAGEEVDHAKKLADTESVGKTLDVNVESHADVATRSLAVWTWLSNAADRVGRTGKNAEDVAKAIDSYEKLYGKLAPHMMKYIGYLLKWFF